MPFFKSCGSDFTLPMLLLIRGILLPFCNRYPNKPNIIYNEDYCSLIFTTRKTKMICPRSSKNKEKELNSNVFTHPLRPGLELFHVKVIILQLKAKSSRMEPCPEKNISLLKLILTLYISFFFIVSIKSKTKENNKKETLTKAFFILMHFKRKYSMYKKALVTFFT